MMKKLLLLMLVILPMAATAHGTSLFNSQHQITSCVQAFSTLTLPHWQATEDDIEDQKAMLMTRLNAIVSDLTAIEAQLQQYEDSQLSSYLVSLRSVAANLSASISAATTADDIAECQSSIYSLQTDCEALQDDVSSFIQNLNNEKTELRTALIYNQIIAYKTSQAQGY